MVEAALDRVVGSSMATIMVLVGGGGEDGVGW